MECAHVATGVLGGECRLAQSIDIDFEVDFFSDEKMSALATNEKMSASDSDDSADPEITMDALRPEALAALMEVRQARDDAVAREAESTDGAIAEDFGLSQFWYSDACSDALGAAVVRAAGGGRVAIVSCPSVHRALCRAAPDDASSVLFEYDTRCGAHLPPSRFAKYDFRADFTAAIPAEFAGGFDFVVLDPPYVSHDCIDAFWAFARWLSRGDAPRALFLTSVVNRDWLSETHDLQLTNYDLEFSSKLATPLRAFSNSSELAAGVGGFAA